jgi:hypothetical protein
MVMPASGCPTIRELSHCVSTRTAETQVSQAAFAENFILWSATKALQAPEVLSHQRQTAMNMNHFFSCDFGSFTASK